MEEQVSTPHDDILGNDNTKAAKIERERSEVLHRVSSGSLQSTRDKVAYILNNNHQARNSDKELAWEYWKFYEPAYIQGDKMSQESFLLATSYVSISRARAKIQNEYKLFEANQAVKKRRRTLQEGFENDAIEDKPEGMGTYAVYIDETGKTQDYLAVGSLWILDSGLNVIKSKFELEKWIKDKNINFEFHFKNITNHRLDIYKSFFQKFLGLYPTLCFKYIVVKNKGFANVNDAITDLTFHLIHKGIDHENTSGRAKLPKYLQVWIDKDEDGSDGLKIANIQARLSAQNIEGLYLDSFEAVSSSDHHLIQAIDLYTGAINRKLNTPEGENVKDKFADFIIETLRIDINDIDKENAQIDHSVLFNLK